MQSRAEQWYSAILDLLREANLCQPDHMPLLINAITEQVANSFTIFLVDHEQRTLRELTTAPGGTGEQYPVEGSLAGRTYQRSRVEAQPGSRHVLWIPLVDSTERLGVVRIVAEEPFAPAPYHVAEPAVQFVNLLGHLLTAKTPYGDRLHQGRSSEPMTVASVLLRQLLPPSTFTSDRLAISASMQPAYAVGGDAYDYAIDGDGIHVAVFDGVGHGVPAGLSVALTLSATRATRRNGAGIAHMAEEADTHLNAEFDDSRFVTAVLTHLDLNTGALHYLNAGHPPPIVVRPNGGIVTLEHGRRTPLGISTTPVQLGHHRLHLGDRLLFYTDGVVESRGPGGEFFTVDRLVEIARRLVLADESTPEVARKINQSVAEFHGGPPEDDSTVVILEWSPTAAHRMLP